ncbi:MAG: hypothetical protein HY840_15375 [Bacteroidetes bacterium]|nr:hypothetical protein [Bacteroidota bacterium]
MLILNAGTAAELRFFEPSASGTNYSAFKAQAQSADLTYTLPASLTAGNYLQTDGSGNLTWTAVSTHTQLHSMTSQTDHSAGNWKVFYSDGAAHIQELALGSANQVLTSQGTTSAPTWTSASSINAIPNMVVNPGSPWTIPAGVTKIIIEAWGGGGAVGSDGTAGNNTSVTGTNITITANGGAKGLKATSGTAGGSGGTASAAGANVNSSYTVTGGNGGVAITDGTTSAWAPCTGGNAGGGGGPGANSIVGAGPSGQIPAGGAAGGTDNTTGGSGAQGRVIIWY